MMTLLLLLFFPQTAYVRKPFPGGKTMYQNHDFFQYEVPVTLDQNGEATIIYDSLYPGKRYTQACYPEREEKDKDVRFFHVEEDDNHIRIGTEPKKPGLKITYHCSVAVAKAKKPERGTQ